jgi:hypothetical protein
MKSSLVFALTTTLIFTGTSALAQTAAPAAASNGGDPFEDYAAANPDAPVVNPVVPPEVIQKNAIPAAKSGGTEKSAVKIPSERGGLLFGAGAAFSYTSSKNEVLSGADASNSNFFFRLQGHAAYTLIDRVQVGLGLGIMSKSLGREAGEKATETNYFFELNGTYMLPIADRFAFAPGAGVGLYGGSSSRTLFIPGANNTSASTTESTGTFGLHASANVLVAYQLSQNFQLRSGLTFTGLFGSESVDSANRSLGSSAFHVGLPLQLNYTLP